MIKDFFQFNHWILVICVTHNNCMANRFLKEYLSFSKKERTGTFILMALIIACIAAPFFYSFFIPEKKYDHSAFDKEISQLKIQQADSSSDRKFYSKNFDESNYSNYNEPSEKNYNNIKSEVFYFDPNTASADDWKYEMCCCTKRKWMDN